MVDFPYGRSGSPELYYEEEITEDRFDESESIGDNEVKRVNGKVYVYEAPAEDDPGRGHLSQWVESETEAGTYINAKALSGDDGMIRDKFEQY